MKLLVPHNVMKLVSGCGTISFARMTRVSWSYLPLICIKNRGRHKNVIYKMSYND